MRISDWSSDVCSSDLLGIYTATVRVTVAGCPSHSDVGVAAVEEQTPEHHATAYKAAVTDGLKRALRHLGAGLGNELSARLGRTDDTCPAVDSEPLRREVIAIAERAGSDEARTREWVAEKYGRSEEHTSALQSLMRISYAVFCL